MTSPISPKSPLPIDDLRRRVREAEALLGVARGLARDELHDPASCERARDRIISILHEIDSLFPGLNDPPPVLDPEEMVAPSMRNRPAAPAVEVDSGLDPHDGEGGEGGGDGEEEEDGEGEEAPQPEGDGEGEWELDTKKLAAAIENDQLMSKIPEVDREWFRQMARRSIEAQERVDLCERVRKAFDELSVVMRDGLDETSRQLSMALTLEQLKAKQQQ